MIPNKTGWEETDYHIRVKFPDVDFESSIMMDLYKSEFAGTCRQCASIGLQLLGWALGSGQIGG